LAGLEYAVGKVGEQGDWTSGCTTAIATAAAADAGEHVRAFAPRFLMLLGDVLAQVG